VTGQATPVVPAAPSRWRSAVTTRRSPMLIVGGVIVATALILAVIGPIIAPYDPVEPTPDVLVPPPALADIPSLILQTLNGSLEQPVHWFGTDQTGLDIFSRVIAAPQVDVLIGVAATALALVVGTSLGLMAGYFRGRSAGFIARASDVFQSIPIFVLAMIVVVFTGRSTAAIVVTLAILYTPIYLRLTSSEVAAQAARRHIEASRAIGNRELVTAVRHVLPNALTPALVQASVTIGWAILFTAGLTFLGAGVRPPTPEWGGMIASGANLLILGQWWPSLFPGIAISITVFGFAIVGDRLEARFRG
jgi:peptide/nickel transport system permease protein